MTCDLQLLSVHFIRSFRNWKNSYFWLVALFKWIKMHCFLLHRLIYLCSMKRIEAMIILAGDSRQLGPIVQLQMTAWEKEPATFIPFYLNTAEHVTLLRFPLTCSNGFWFGLLYVFGSFSLNLFLSFTYFSKKKNRSFIITGTSG